MSLSHRDIFRLAIAQMVGLPEPNQPHGEREGGGRGGAGRGKSQVAIMLDDMIISTCCDTPPLLFTTHIITNPPHGMYHSGRGREGRSWDGNGGVGTP